jgi:hypothetical protein
MTGPEIIRRVKLAIARYRREARPLQWDAAERSFVHRLAVHMEKLFRGWNVDCEYNKDGDFTKLLMGIKECKKQKKTNKVFPDIIVHKRNTRRRAANLLVVEVKNKSDRDVCDNRKLELFTSASRRYRYQLGLYINIDCGKFKKKWYQAGKEKPEKEII